MKSSRKFTHKRGTIVAYLTPNLNSKNGAFIVYRVISCERRSPYGKHKIVDVEQLFISVVKTIEDITVDSLEALSYTYTSRITDREVKKLHRVPNLSDEQLNKLLTFK